MTPYPYPHKRQPYRIYYSKANSTSNQNQNNYANPSVNNHTELTNYYTTDSFTYKITNTNSQKINTQVQEAFSETSNRNLPFTFGHRSQDFFYRFSNDIDRYYLHLVTFRILTDFFNYKPYTIIENEFRIAPKMKLRIGD